MVAVADRPTSADRTKAALWFAEHGFGVFSVWSTKPDGTCRCPAGGACTSPGKHPVTANGFHDATTDPKRIRTLLAAGSDPNYGLVCPDGVFGLDIDGPDLQRFAALEAELGPLPGTLRTLTANGQHVFLRWPADRPQPLHKMFGFVTRWGSGGMQGYLIGPRSIHHSGFAYAPDGPFEIAEIPQGWADAALRTERPAEGVIRGPEPLPGVGGRHDWLRDRARYLRGVLDNPKTLRAAMLEENARLEEPKTEEEVDRAIGDVYERFPLDPVEATEERVARKLGEDELDLLGQPASGVFPDPPATIAFGGVLGECVADLADGTDASMVGLLGSALIFAGGLIPGSAYFHRHQTSSPFVALVGESAVGRKGTAMTRVLDAFSDALETVNVNRVVIDGLNSGEGLVATLHYKREHYATEPTVGIVFEEEYASLLASRGREGSTLDPKMRQAFDGGPLSNRRSGETKTVVPLYWLPALIGITPVELRSRLEPGALQSGSANRWLYLPVQRRQIVPFNSAPRFEDEHRAALLEAYRAAQKRPPELQVDAAVTRTLAEYADFLPTASYGLARDLTRRLAIIAFRVALVHALVERSSWVLPKHLDRALALTEYARRGIDWVFGDTIGNPDANLLYRYLIDQGRLSTRTIARNLIRDPLRRQAAIDELLRIGRAVVETERSSGSGRPRVYLAKTGDTGSIRPFVTSDEKPEVLSQVLSQAVYARNGGFVSSVPDSGLPSVTSDYTETRDFSDKTPNHAQTAVTKPVTKPGQNVTKLTEPPASEAAHRPDGTTWCHYFIRHQSRHRDVSQNPWCEICTPKETP